ncbi:unnamed protein product [Durusdinium trenchii]|uniref:Uncharacterized protein n=1 Tax=Durusdinium trenchii TaxID=1381693 RepID=A0ABP0MR47_9DINO
MLTESQLDSDVGDSLWKESVPVASWVDMQHCIQFSSFCSAERPSEGYRRQKAQERTPETPETWAKRFPLAGFARSITQSPRVSKVSIFVIDTAPTMNSISGESELLNDFNLPTGGHD